MKFSECLRQFINHLQLEIGHHTIDRYMTDLRLFCLYLRDPVIETVTEQDIIEYFQLMLHLGWKQNSLYPKAAGFRRFFQFLRDKNFNVLNPRLIPVIKKEFFMPRVCTDEELVALFDVINKESTKGNVRRAVHVRNKALIGMYVDTGARNGELLKLNLNDLCNEPKIHQGEKFYYATIQTEKSRGMRPFRQVYWTEQTQKDLKQWISEREKWSNKTVFENPEAVFVGSGAGHCGKRITNHAVAIFLRQYSRLANIRTVNAHSFRHRKGRNTIMDGGSNSDVMNILGHSQINSSTPYTMMVGKDLETRAIEFLKKRPSA